MDFKRKSGMAVVLDCWRILPHERFAGQVDYLMLGSGASPSPEAARRLVYLGLRALREELAKLGDD